MKFNWFLIEKKYRVPLSSIERTKCNQRVFDGIKWYTLDRMLKYHNR